jgi:hypothetical protein
VLQPNAFGLHDMLGNLAEWTCSLYDRDYSGAEARCADQAGLAGSGPRVIRGGSWLHPPGLVRAAARDGFPQLGLKTVDFRVVGPLAADETPRRETAPRKVCLPGALPQAGRRVIAVTLSRRGLDAEAASARRLVVD